MRKLLAVLLLFSTTATFAASRQPVLARHAMVASTSEIASRVGVEVMKKGGNAVDAAVAVAFALAVTWPSAGNLGGGGFMLVRKSDGTAEAIDYRERAPLAATRDMYLDANGKVIEGASTQGYKAVGVPGTVAGLALAHKRFGRLPWADLVEPARKLAAHGFVLNQYVAHSLGSRSTIKRLAPFPESVRIFERNGRFYQLGDRFAQPDLAKTLAAIQKDPRSFYEGEIATKIAADMQAHGGLITSEDFKAYEPTIRKPLRGTYRDYEIITMPPPSSGGIALLEMLNILEPYDLQAMGFHSSQEIHTVVEAMRRAFADRAKYLGDTDFAKGVPVTGLISRAYAAEIRKSIDPAKATPSSVIEAGNPLPYESKETTHFTIIDSDGNVVSNTYTLNDSFGSGVTVKGTGFLLNDEMDDFTSKPGVPNNYGLLQSEANAIAPKKRPLSAMTPTIVLKDGKVAFAIGSPGGPTIINTVLQVVLNVIDFGMDIQQGISEPRFHHQWMPDEIYAEPLEFNADTRTALEKMGHVFRKKLEDLGDAQGVAVDAKTGMREGGSDPRLGGVAVGY
jgi:gamma-glutamyltranspeptidase / glutathione hydrolase